MLHSFADGTSGGAPRMQAAAHGLRAGVHNGVADVAKARVAMGFDFVTLGSDARLLAAGSQGLLKQMRTG